MARRADPLVAIGVKWPMSKLLPQKPMPVGRDRRARRLVAIGVGERKRREIRKPEAGVSEKRRRERRLAEGAVRVPISILRLSDRQTLSSSFVTCVSPAPTGQTRLAQGNALGSQSEKNSACVARSSPQAQEEEVSRQRSTVNRKRDWRERRALQSSTISHLQYPI